MQVSILFCENPLEKNAVEPDFAREYAAANEAGFVTLLLNYDDLLIEERQLFALKRIRPAETETLVIYRGWMLTPEQYAMLFGMLHARNYTLANTATEYQNCHYLPDSLQFIASKTPATIYQPIVDKSSIELLIDSVAQFGASPVVIKDYVKSEKHDWETACFVPDASNKEFLRTSINNLIRLRGDYLNKGIVIREFVALQPMAVHSKSGIPLMEEYRLFFLFNKLVGVYDYWEEGEYTAIRPDIVEFETLAQRIKSNFFSMDIARQTNGSFTIIELGDGQVAGLPDSAGVHDFYGRLKNIITSK